MTNSTQPVKGITDEILGRSFGVFSELIWFAIYPSQRRVRWLARLAIALVVFVTAAMPMIALSILLGGQAATTLDITWPLISETVAHGLKLWQIAAIQVCVRHTFQDQEDR